MGVRPSRKLHREATPPTEHGRNKKNLPKIFEINHIAGTREAGDVTFRMLVTFGESLAFNTRRGQTWESVERTTSCPVTKGSAFDILFWFNPDGWEVYLNGQKVYLFRHRLPAEKVNTLHIYGDTVINVMGTVPNWSSSTFGKELISGTSRSVNSNIQSDVPYPVSNPKKAYTGTLPVPLRPGVALFFQGVVPSGFESFAINLMVDNDIAFHFNPRKNLVAYDSCRNGTWEKILKLQEAPLSMAEPLISCTLLIQQAMSHESIFAIAWTC
ncbi:hypothetical protein QTP86_014774 [Hemibagrus guttatus]|nr:hypothetical protein QTP86_014774 [Hemibagrus guttatus]